MRKEETLTFKKERQRFCVTHNGLIAWRITRPHFRSRLLDALEPNYLPYEAFRLRPYELLCRYEAKKEFS